MLRTFAAASALLVLSGCASYQAHEGRIELKGRAYDEAETCLGVPAHTDKMSDGSLVAQWEYNDSGASTAIPLSELALLPVTLPLSLAGTVTISGNRSCHAIAHVVNGRIATLIYTGASGDFSGPNAACAPIVRGCLQMFRKKR